MFNVHSIKQGRKWLPKTGWASSNAAAPSILPKTGWAIAHPAHPPLTPLHIDSAVEPLSLHNLYKYANCPVVFLLFLYTVSLVIKPLRGYT